jgi:hypothetical protein
MKTNVQDLAITALGAVSSVLTALLLWYVAEKTDFSFYTLMHWFIVPTGAICSGFVAAAGYYAGAVLFHHRPHRLMLLSMTAIAVGTYFLINYFEYRALEVDGERVSNVVGFWEYLDFRVSHSSYSFGHTGSSSAVDIGRLGYLFAVLQVLGFATGGFVIYGVLASRLYCDRCGRYFSTKYKKNKQFAEMSEVESLAGELSAAFNQKRFTEAVTRYAAPTPAPKLMKRRFLTTFKIEHCTTCNKHHLLFEAHRQTGSSFAKIPHLTQSAFSDTPVDKPLF